MLAGEQKYSEINKTSIAFFSASEFYKILIFLIRDEW
jgi:hypothetical protein